MAGVVPSVLGSRTFAFILFILLVWVAVDLGLVLAGVAPSWVPSPVRTLMAPSGAAAATQDAQTKL